MNGSVHPSIPHIPLWRVQEGIYFYRTVSGNTWYDFFYVLLTVHLSIFILVINQLDAQNFVLQ